jgi:hypothetical protein
MALLDLVEQDASVLSTHSQSGQIINFGRVGQVLGYEKHAAADFAIYSELKKSIDAWSSSSPTLTQILNTAINGTEWRFSEFNVSPAADRYVANEVSQKECEKIIPAVIYSDDLGALTATSVWNQLDFESQMGLVLHESLRHMQLTYGISVNTKTIQELTAKIILQNPESGESLDVEKYLGENIFGFMQNTKAQKQQLVDAQKLACKVLTSIKTEIAKNLNDLATLDSVCAGTSDDPFKLGAVHELLYSNYWKLSSIDDKDTFTDASNAVSDVITQMNQSAMGMNTLSMIDTGRPFMKFDFTFGEDELIQYAQGTGKFSFRERSKIKAAIKQIHAALKDLGADHTN